jgi:MYXO-CTERM domain-containing protein
LTDWIGDVRAFRQVARLGIALAVSLLPSAVLAQGIRFEGSSTGAGADLVIAFDHITPAAADRYLVVAVAMRSGSNTVLSVTHGGRALGPIATASSGGYCRLELWGLAGPIVGTARVEVTVSAGGAFTAAAVGYAGVDQSTPFGNIASAFGTGTAASLALPSGAAELVVDALCSQASSTPSATPAAAQTRRWAQSSNNLYASGSDVPGGPDLALSWTINVTAGGQAWGIAAAALRPAAPQTDGGPTPDTSPPPDTAAPPVDTGNPAPDTAHPADTAAPSDGPDAPVADGPPGASDGRPADAPVTGPDAGADRPVGADAAIRARDINLSIGCACQTPAGERPATALQALLAGLALALAVRRRYSPRR